MKDKESVRYKALKNAMILYKKIKPVLTRGVFYGIDSIIHLHVGEDKGTGVITAYNLTSRNKTLKIEIDLNKYGLQFQEIEMFNGINQMIKPLSIFYEQNKILKCEVEIPSLSPIIAVLI